MAAGGALTRWVVDIEAHFNESDCLFRRDRAELIVAVAVRIVWRPDTPRLARVERTRAIYEEPCGDECHVVRDVHVNAAFTGKPQKSAPAEKAGRASETTN